MRKKLKSKGREVDFFEPYLIYDHITVFNKSIEVYVVQRRATGISYSSKGEIIISMAICSLKDSFVKKKARSIIHSRTEYMVDRVLHPKFNKFVDSSGESYYFVNLDAFTEYISVFDAASKLLFTPHYIKQTVARDSSLNSQVPKKMVIDLDAIKEDSSIVYWHTDFINRTYVNFMSFFDEEGIQITTIKKSEETLKEKLSNDEIPF